MMKLDLIWLFSNALLRISCYVLFIAPFNNYWFRLYLEVLSCKVTWKK